MSRFVCLKNVKRYNRGIPFPNPSNLTNIHIKMNLRHILPISLATIALGFASVSCHSGAQKLGSEISGVWADTPEAFSDNAAVTAMVTDTYCFMPDTTGNARQPSGPVSIQGMVPVNTQIVSEDFEISPLSLTAAAVATIRGTWTALDDDELSLNLDPSTLKVMVDPDEVSSTPSAISVTPPAIDSIRPVVADNISRSLTTALAARYAGIRLFDDVKIKGKLMKYEIGHKDHVLTRQSEKMTE